MAADRSRLAAALAYRQAEEERRRRMMESVPVPGAELPAPAPSQNLRRDLENLSIGLGRGITTGLEGVKGIITDPVGTAKGVYEAGRAVVRDPSVIADALRYTAQKATSGPLGAGEVIGEMLGPRKGGPMMQELDVYHGTPHRFPATEANPLGEFDASKIGTGEGAQAYGHGIYYAENPDVAKGYQSSLSADRGFSFEGKTGLTRAEVQDMVNAKYGKGYLDNILRPSGVADSFIDDMVTGVTRAEGAYPKQYKPGSERAKLYDELRGKITHASPGTLYKADLPDEMIDRMLDWDKPLSEQPAAIKNLFPTLEEAKAIEAEMIRLSEATLAANDINGPAQAAWEAMYKSPQYKMAKIVVDEADPKLGKKFANGQKIYRAISGGDDKASAEQLRAFGIPGIKYLDAGSRGAGGTGTRNFVVFPGEEKKVRILERK